MTLTVRNHGGMNDLTTYELAWLVGGGERVAVVAFVALATEGRIEVAYRRQRVEVARYDASDPVEVAALDLLPDSGLSVREFVERVAASPTVAALEAAARGKGRTRLRALRRFNPAYRDLIEHPGTGLRRVAVLGVAGVADENLKDILEHPRPDVPKITPHKPVTDNTFDGTIAPNPSSFLGP
jgi:uncharacterized protein (TIGR04222 family)